MKRTTNSNGTVRGGVWGVGVWEVWEQGSRGEIKKYISSPLRLQDD
ncbi:MAG: hypothetical protein WBA93_25920 [Microcoleaceae cyanobacterium]